MWVCACVRVCVCVCTYVSDNKCNVKFNNVMQRKLVGEKRRSNSITNTEKTTSLMEFVHLSEGIPSAIHYVYFTRHNVVPPLSHVKTPELCGVSQDLAVSQTGYITRLVKLLDCRQF